MKKLLLVLLGAAMLTFGFTSCGDKPAETPDVKSVVYEASSQWAEIGFDVTGLASLTVEFAELPKDVQFKVYAPEAYPQITAAKAVCENPEGNEKITIQCTGSSATVKIVKVTGTKADGSTVDIEVDLTKNGSWGWAKK